MNDEYEKIEFSFLDKSNKIKGEDKEFISKCPVLYFPNKQIATICETFENPDTHEIESEITKPGMTKKEILQLFISDKLKVFSINYLIRSVIYESYRKEGLTIGMEEGNVRHFWYTHLKSLLVPTRLNFLLMKTSVVLNILRLLLKEICYLNEQLKTES